MGSLIQEVFQGRRDKKRQGVLIQRSSLLLCIVLTWLGLQKDYPLSMPILWFSFGSVIAALNAFFHFRDRRKSFSIEFLFSLALLFEGLIHALKLTWVKPVYFPLVIMASIFYSWKTILPLAFLLPFIWLKDVFMQQLSAEKITFPVSLLATAVISTIIFTRFRKEKDKAIEALKTIKDTARSISPQTGMESLDRDEVVSHYFASVLKTDEEITELLCTIKHAVFADSANFFIPHRNSFALRCSSEKKGDIIITGEGIISACIRDKKPFYSGEASEKKLDAGYIKNSEISSIFALPLMEGSVLTGVLTVDTSRYQAFSEPDRNTIQMFSNHLLRILERERIYTKLKRDYNGLKILNEESSNLIASLDINVMAKKLCEAAEKIASSQVFFFISKDNRFELLHPAGSFPEKKTLFDLKGTFINMAVENKNALYMTDITDYRSPVMPFKTDPVSSIIALPLLYENNLLGLLVMLSEKKSFLDTFQTDLLKVMCNQASTSIANAKLHAEIEQLATTDGLTGLYNHRVFQEKLSDELKRLSRYPETISLLLIDIDFFKKINDSYGHPVGDLVLKEVAAIIKETIRDIDIPARYGGEEFAAILPQTENKGAKNIAERLRKAVMDTSFSSDSAEFRVTLSIGISTSPADAKSKEELIEKADQALYYAKHNGRNRSITWSEIR